MGVSRWEGGSEWGLSVAPNPTLQFSTTSRYCNIYVVVCLLECVYALLMWVVNSYFVPCLHLVFAVLLSASN